jgi:hypothetical protein
VSCSIPELADGEYGLQVRLVCYETFMDSRLDIDEKWFNDAQEAKIQHDGAPAHTSQAFLERWETLLVGLVIENVLPHVGKVRLVVQLANSPDLNNKQ